MPINRISGNLLHNMHHLNGTRGPGSSAAGMHGMPSGVNNQLNALLLSGATFVTEGAARAAQLRNTLTDLQTVLGRVIPGTDNTDAMTVRSFTGREIPEVSVEIQQAAATQRNEGKALRSSERTIPAGTFRFEIEVDGQSRQISFTTTEELTNRAFQQRMAEAINSADIGVTASVTTRDNDRYSILNIETRTTGAGNDGPRFTIRDVDGGAVERLGVDNIAQEARDAKFTVNGGEQRTSASNDIELAGGLSVTLIRASEYPVNITSTGDTTGIRDSVRQMVSQFNSLLEAARANPLDNRTRALVREMEGLIRRNRRALTEIGVSMNDRGVLTISESRLRAASEDGTARNVLGGTTNSLVHAMTGISESVSLNPTRHVSPHLTRLPEFNAALRIVREGNETPANQPQPSIFDNYFRDDLMHFLFNQTR